MSNTHHVLKAHPCRARAEGMAAQMVVLGKIDKYDRLVVARMIEDAMERDRARRDDTSEEETLP